MLGEPWLGDAGAMLKALWHCCPKLLDPRGRSGTQWQIEAHPQDNQPPAQRHLADTCVRGCQTSLKLEIKEQKR